MVLAAWISIAVALCCALFIFIDELRHPQAMAIMNVVWPITALYFSVFALWGYFTLGRRHTREAMQSHGMQQQKQRKSGPPSAAQVAIGTSHCGAGCMLADLITEFAIAAAGLVILGSVLWAEYILDFIAAWALGIVFQYFAIRPMRQDLSRGAAIAAAIKADTLSILAFQIGMYAWMALVYFVFFPHPHLTPFDVRYWLMMQLAMILGFATSFPVNRVLLGLGWKEAM